MYVYMSVCVYDLVEINPGLDSSPVDNTKVSMYIYIYINIYVCVCV